MRRNTSTWRRRIAVLLALWLALGGVLAWIGSDPSWLGLLAAASALAGFSWLLADVSPQLAATSWVTDTQPASRQPAVDGRLTVLRRLAEMAGEAPPDGSRTRPSAIELQTLLRAATEQRVRAREGATDLPPELADYLRAEPAPIVSPDQLDRLLTRIEAL